MEKRELRVREGLLVIKCSTPEGTLVTAADNSLFSQNRLPRLPRAVLPHECSEFRGFGGEQGKRRGRELAIAYNEFCLL